MCGLRRRAASAACDDSERLSSQKGAAAGASLPLTLIPVRGEEEEEEEEEEEDKPLLLSEGEGLPPKGLPPLGLATNLATTRESFPRSPSARIWSVSQRETSALRRRRLSSFPELSACVATASTSVLRNFSRSLQSWLTRFEILARSGADFVFAS